MSLLGVRLGDMEKIQMRKLFDRMELSYKAETMESTMRVSIDIGEIVRQISHRVRGQAEVIELHIEGEVYKYKEKFENQTIRSSKGWHR